MATFDAPSRELCLMRRVRTNTPLQAFVCLNDPVYVEAAQALARRIASEGGSCLSDRARFGLKLCLGRPPSSAQVDVLVRLWETEQDHYQQDEVAAGQLATDPLGPLPEGSAGHRDGSLDRGGQRAAESGRCAQQIGRRPS